MEKRLDCRLPLNATNATDGEFVNCINNDEVNWSKAELRAMLCRLAYPPLLAIGVLCNLLALFTFQQRRLRRSPVSLCLSALAVLDSLVLLTSTLRYWLKYQANFDWQVANIYVCRVSLFLEYFTADGSVWTLLLVTAQRYVGTHFPLRAGKYCNRGRTCLFLLAVAALCAVKNLPLLIRARVMSLPLAGTLCQIVYDHQLWVAFSWTDTTFRFLIPFPSLLFLNFSICRKVRAARRFRRGQRTTEYRSSLHSTATQNHCHYNYNCNNNNSNYNGGHKVNNDIANRVSRRATTDPLPSLLDADDPSRRISQMSGVVKQAAHLDDGRRMLMMLVVVNFVFLACQFPFCVFSLVDSFMELVKKAVTSGDTSAYYMLSFCFQLALTLVYASHATNFFFYCLSGRLFRHTLIKMLRCRQLGLCAGRGCGSSCCGGRGALRLQRQQRPTLPPAPRPAPSQPLVRQAAVDISPIE